MLGKRFIPTLPFANFKWKWASLQCTEGINDPVILLGVLYRMRRLEPLGLKYSSPEFAQELVSLSHDTEDSIGVDLARRTGDRNLIRNSGQYWRAVGLLAPGDGSGVIRLTDFGRRVADREISQTEFAATTIQTFRLPNPHIQSEEECLRWIEHGLNLHPLRLILEIGCELLEKGEGFISTEELVRIVIPLSACQATIGDYVKFIHWYRCGEITLEGWPDCVPGSNDLRIAREYLLFLSNYGYLERKEGQNRLSECYYLCSYILEEIKRIIAERPPEDSYLKAINEMRLQKYMNEFERKRAQVRVERPNQPAFRRAILKACERCVITNVSMPEVLEAAHIKPFKYNGADTVGNGFAMRTDIHTLFDTGHLRISPEGIVELSHRARLDYGASIPPRIVVPPFIDSENLRWRWENYSGL